MPKRLNLSWGSGFCDPIYDARRDLVLWYGDVVIHDFHRQYGGECYYTSRSGLSGAGWIHDRPWIVKLREYRDTAVSHGLDGVHAECLNGAIYVCRHPAGAFRVVGTQMWWGSVADLIADRGAPVQDTIVYRTYTWLDRAPSQVLVDWTVMSHYPITPGDRRHIRWIIRRIEAARKARALAERPDEEPPRSDLEVFAGTAWQAWGEWSDPSQRWAVRYDVLGAPVEVVDLRQCDPAPSAWAKLGWVPISRTQFVRPSSLGAGWDRVDLVSHPLSWDDEIYVERLSGAEQLKLFGRWSCVAELARHTDELTAFAAAAKAIEAGNELDHDFAPLEPIVLTHDPLVTRDDAIAAGLCQTGVDEWIARHQIDPDAGIHASRLRELIIAADDETAQTSWPRLVATVAARVLRQAT